MSQAKKSDKNEGLYQVLNSIFGLLTFCGGGLLVIGLWVIFEDGEMALMFTLLPSCLAPLLIGLLGQWMVKNRLRYQASRAVMLMSLLLISMGMLFTGLASAIVAVSLDSSDAMATLLLAGICLLPALLLLLGGGLLFRFGRGGDEELPEEERAREAAKLEESLKETDYDEYFE